jgi:hypothetical protein
MWFSKSTLYFSLLSATRKKGPSHPTALFQSSIEPSVLGTLWWPYSAYQEETSVHKGYKSHFHPSMFIIVVTRDIVKAFFDARFDFLQ